MIRWISVNDERFTPDCYQRVIVAHRPKNGDEDWGISFASFQYDKKTKSDYWMVDETLRGEFYDKDYDEITHWFPLLDELNYPDSYYE